MKEIKLSIDKVSIIIKTKAYIKEFLSKQYQTRKAVEKMVSYLQRNNLIKEDVKYSKLYYFHFSLIEDIDLQFLPKFQGREVLTQVNQFTGEEKRIIIRFDRDNFIRLEWNPNNTDIRKIANLLKFIAYEFYIQPSNLDISRLDIAIDYPVKFDLITIEADNSLSFALVGKKSTGVQTNYQGSRSSDIFFRIYDKKAELERQGIKVEQEYLTRFELINSSGFSVEQEKIDNHFEKLRFSSYPIQTDDEILNLILRCSARDGIASVLGGFHRNTRLKYRKLIKAYERHLYFEHPSKIYDEEFLSQWKAFQNSIYEAFGFKGSVISHAET